MRLVARKNQSVIRRGLLGVFFLTLCLESCGRREGSAAPQPSAVVLANRLDADLRRVRMEVEGLSKTVAGLYQSKDEILPTVNKEKYEFAPNGSFYKPVNDGKGALWISGSVPITEQVREVAYFTEPLDRDLMRVKKQNSEIVQAYYLDSNSLIRIYPWMDAIAQFVPKIRFPDFNFYYLADEAHNPLRRGVWVDEPYADPAGRGWMVSAIAPVYQDGRMVGVAGSDVTIATIMDRYFNKVEAPLAILAANGVLVAATPKALQLLELPPITEHKYIEAVKLDTLKPDDYNLLRSPMREVRAMATTLIKGGANQVVIQLGDGRYRAHVEEIPETRWKLLEFLEE